LQQKIKIKPELFTEGRPSQNKKSMKAKANKTHAVLLNTDLFPCVCVAMYDTVLDPRSYADNLRDAETMANTFCYVNIDREKYEDEILNRAAAFIDENVTPLLEKYGLRNIQTVSIDHPKYYNYKTDALMFYAEMAPKWKTTMRRWLKEFAKEEKFQEYIDAHFKSYDGFCSFMPQSFQAIAAMEDEDRCLGAYLQLCLLNENATNLWRESMDEISEWIWENSKSSEVGDYLEERLGADAYDLAEFYEDDCKWNELYWSLAAKVGFPWLHDDTTKSLPNSSRSSSFEATNDAQRCIIWAVQHDYTLSDLQRLAA